MRDSFIENHMYNKHFPSFLRHLSASLCSLFLLVGLIHSSGALAAATCTNGTNMSGMCVPTDTGMPATSIEQIILNVMNWLLGILGIVAMLVFVIAGFQYLTAGGDEKNTESAKGNIKYAIIGVAVALIGYVVIYTINMLLTGTGTDPDGGY